jgi:hypothetical protein
MVTHLYRDCLCQVSGQTKEKQKHLGVLVTWIGAFLELMSKVKPEGGS